MKFSRLWGVRHIRAIYWSYRVHQWARTWGSVGIGIGGPNPSDLQHLQDIWGGRA